MQIPLISLLGLDKISIGSTWLSPSWEYSELDIAHEDTSTTRL